MKHWDSLKSLTLLIDGLVGGLALLLSYHGALIIVDCVVNCLALNKQKKFKIKQPKVI